MLFHENQITGLKKVITTQKKQEDVSAYIKDRLAEKYRAIKISWRVLRKGEFVNIYWRRPGGEQCLLNIRNHLPDNTV